MWTPDYNLQILHSGHEGFNNNSCSNHQWCTWWAKNRSESPYNNSNRCIESPLTIWHGWIKRIERRNGNVCLHVRSPSLHYSNSLWTISKITVHIEPQALLKLWRFIMCHCTTNQVYRGWIWYFQRSQFLFNLRKNRSIPSKD